jgi:hypothetical protein
MLQEGLERDALLRRITMLSPVGGIDAGQPKETYVSTLSNCSRWTFRHLDF